MIFLKIESFWAKKKFFSEKNFLGIFSIFGAPKKPKKSKFQENEKNVRRYFPRDAKKPKTHHPRPSGQPRLYPKDPLKTAKSAQNAIFRRQNRAKKWCYRKNEKNPWRYAHNDAKYQKSPIYDHPVSLEARAKTRKNGLFWTEKRLNYSLGRGFLGKKWNFLKTCVTGSKWST